MITSLNQQDLYTVLGYPIDMSFILPGLEKPKDIESFFVFLRRKNCNIVNKEEITDFLSNYIGIIDYLYEAPNVIRKKFGDVNLNLELVFDPEIEGRDGELFLNIETDLEVKEAREKLKEIDREWLIPVVGKNIIKFNLSLDFI